PAGALGAAAAALVAWYAAAAPSPAEEILYRKDENGALVLTNVPDHQDLRHFAGRGSVRGPRSGERYREMITRTALRHGVNPDLAFAVAAVESNFDPWAVSAKGAQGLMQLMPDTATRFGVKDSFDPEENVLGGVRYLRYLLDLFKGDLRLTVAAYNAGENIVQELRGVPPYRETRGYVGKVLKLFGNRPPYVTRPAGRSVAAGRAVETPIETYTDGGGVVHYTDSPPAGGAPSQPR
ncbi:MAG: lytic transglycosylase domain-containing protein, partial [Candidatus Polarisedimenticolia bacterium]